MDKKEQIRQRIDAIREERDADPKVERARRLVELVNSRPRGDKLIGRNPDLIPRIIERLTEVRDQLIAEDVAVDEALKHLKSVQEGADNMEQLSPDAESLMNRVKAASQEEIQPPNPTELDQLLAAIDAQDDEPEN